MSEWIKTGAKGPFPPLEPEWGYHYRSSTVLIRVEGRGIDFGWLDYYWVRSARDLLGRVQAARRAGVKPAEEDQKALEAIDLDHPDPSLLEPHRWGRSVGIREGGEGSFDLGEVTYYLEIPPCPK